MPPLDYWWMTPATRVYRWVYTILLLMNCWLRIMRLLRLRWRLKGGRRVVEIVRRTSTHDKFLTRLSWTSSYRYQMEWTSDEKEKREREEVGRRRRGNKRGTRRVSLSLAITNFNSWIFLNNVHFALLRRNYYLIYTDPSHNTSTRRAFILIDQRDLETDTKETKREKGQYGRFQTWFLILFSVHPF